MKPALLHLIVACVFCGMIVIGYGFWYAAISKKSADVSSLQYQIDTKTETMNRIATTRATLADVASDEAVIESYFVSEAGAVAFIDSLEENGKTLETILKVLSVSTDGTKAHPSLTFSLSITGTFDAVMRTVGSIEHAPYALSTSAFSITQQEDGNWRADLELSVGSVPVVRVATSTSKTTSVNTLDF